MEGFGEVVAELATLPPLQRKHGKAADHQVGVERLGRVEAGLARSALASSPRRRRSR